MALPLRAVPLTRLADANPEWPGLPDGTKQQLWFDCPIHEDCRQGVSFTPTFGGPSAPETNEKLWQRTGEDFETVTLSPSIRVLGGPNGCEWHGFIRDGRFEHCGDSR